MFEYSEKVHDDLNYPVMITVMYSLSAQRMCMKVVLLWLLLRTDNFCAIIVTLMVEMRMPMFSIWFCPLIDCHCSLRLICNA